MQVDIAPETVPAVDPRIAGLLELLQLSAAGNMLLNSEARVVFFGGDAAMMLGLDPTSAVQRSVFDLTPAEAHKQLRTAFERGLQGIREPPVAFDTVLTNGATRSVALQFSPVAENGAVLAVMVQVTEVSTRRSANAALHGDLVGSKAAAGGSSLTLFHLDAVGQCTFMGEGWETVTGQPLAQAAGTGWLLAIPEPCRPEFRSIAGIAHQNRHGWITNLVLARASGVPTATRAAASPILDRTGHTTGYIGAIHFPELPSVAAVPFPIPVEPVSLLVEEQKVPETLFASSHDPSDAPEQEQSYADYVAAQELASKPSPGHSANSGPASVDAGFVQQGPSLSAPKFGLPQTAAAGDWTPPVIQEGFTDASLLMGAKPAQREEVQVVVEEPAVDKTTGLANKVLFAQHVQATTARMKADALTVSVSFIDLHGLDLQKDAVGSRIVNDYLFLLAKRLEATIRSIEIAGRIDGNILAVLSINWLFAEDLPIVAQRLINKLSEPLAGKENSDLIVAMNLGMAVAAPNEDVNALFRRAWDALQKSKVRGSGEFEIDTLAG